MLFTLNTIGGWVRLSGSGVAIPQWPIVNGSLLPPLTERGWSEVRNSYEADQERLAQRVRHGELAAGNLGHAPHDLAEFKAMFLTEWSHRLFSALVGVMAAGCITIVMRRRELRRLVGAPMCAAGALIVVQAALGGLLVEEGTGTHWLFLHQGNAAAVMACVLVAMLRLLADGQSRADAAELLRRRAVRVLATVALALAWLQLLAGGLVAGSRNGARFQEWPVLAAGNLWDGHRSLAWNLQDNAWLHQWGHRWLAWLLVAVLAALYLAAWRTGVPRRLGLALKVSATFIGVQAMLGVANVLTGITPAVSLAHQFMGMCLLMSLVLAWFDARHEPGTSIAAPGLAAGSPA
jgi:cytochrome c oxidase assembly protein subunit 15